MAQAATQPTTGNPLKDIFGTLGRILGKILYVFMFIVIILLVIGAGWFGWRYFSFTKETGQLASTVEHGEVVVEEGLSPGKAFLKAKAPDFYTIIYPSEYNPFALDSTVDTSQGKDLGVKITKFEPITSFFRPNTPIRMLGSIKAQGLDKPTKIQVYCYLEDYNEQYNNGELIEALLTGYGAGGNEGTIPKDQPAEFQAQCNFQNGLPEDKQVTSKRARLVVVYDFTTKAYQRVWFLEKAVLDAILAQGADPFEVYAINDQLIDSDRKIRSVTSSGPINLGLAIDFPQPLSDITQYLLLVQISRSFDKGNIQQLNDLKILVPAGKEIVIDLAGEKDLLGVTQCDFEYAGFSEIPGYKEYRLAQHKLEETNQDCNRKSLRELAISERDCIEYYKEPLYLCNFIADTVPTVLTSDTIRAEASYAFKVEKQAVVDIKALPAEVGQELV